MFVPSGTPVKRNRAANIDDDRLFRRRGFLRHLLANPSRFDGPRSEWAFRVGELVAIESVLCTRGKLSPDHRHVKP
jgi:hypothetical protein